MEIRCLWWLECPWALGSSPLVSGLVGVAALEGRGRQKGSLWNQKLAISSWPDTESRLASCLDGASVCCWGCVCAGWGGERGCIDFLNSLAQTPWAVWFGVREPWWLLCARPPLCPAGAGAWTWATAGPDPKALLNRTVSGSTPTGLVDALPFSVTG